MDKKNNSKSNYVEEDYNNGQIENTGRNQKEQYQRIRSGLSTRKRRQIIMGARWDCVYGRKNIHSK